MAITLNDTDVAIRAANNVAAQVGEDVVLLDMDSGSYHQLNVSGASIWEMMDAPIAVSELCARLAARFDVDPVTCRMAVSQFLQQMQAKGLVRIQPA